MYIPLIAKHIHLERFYYLQNLIGPGGGLERVTRARARYAWKKFQKLRPTLFLTKMFLRLKLKFDKPRMDKEYIVGKKWIKNELNDKGWMNRQMIQRTQMALPGTNMYGVTLGLNNLVKTCVGVAFRICGTYFSKWSI